MSVKSIIFLVLISNSLSIVEKSDSFNTLNTIHIDDGLQQTFMQENFINVEPATNSRDAENLDEKIIKILDIGSRPKKLPIEKPLHRSSVRYLYTLYQLMSTGDVPAASAVKNDARYKRSTASNFVSDFDLMEIERCNNIITFAPIKSRHSTNNFKLSFNIDDVPKKFHLERAELRIFKNFTALDAAATNTNDKITVSVYLISDNMDNKRIPLTSISVHVKYSGWLEIDITVALRKLMSNHHLDLTLQIIIYQTDLSTAILNNNDNKKFDESQAIINPSDVGLITIDNHNEEFHPFLIGFFTGPEIIDNLKILKQQQQQQEQQRQPKNSQQKEAKQNKQPNKRLKRKIDPNTHNAQDDATDNKKRNQRQLKGNYHNANNAKKKQYPNQAHIITKANGQRVPSPYLQQLQYKAPKFCQRMNFTVDFRDLNWHNWIIAPEKFDAYFCSGECNFPLGPGMNATNHALIQTLMHLKRPWIPKACCAPRDLGSISVLYHLSEENVNLRKYKHMVAYDCGCH